MALVTLLGIIALAATPQQARAVDIINNLTQTTASTSGVQSTTWVANSFQTDNQSYTLTSVTLNLASNVGSTVTVSLFSNDNVNNKPSSSLGVLGTSAALTPTLTNTLFSAGATLTLNPNTIYWIVAKASANAQWGYTNSQTYSGTGTIPSGFSYADSFDSGGTWNTLPLSSGPQRFQVQGTIIPEPGTLTLLAFGGTLVIGRRRRK